MITRSPGCRTPPSLKCWERSLGAFAIGCNVVQPLLIQTIRHSTTDLFIGHPQYFALPAEHAVGIIGNQKLGVPLSSGVTVDCVFDDVALLAVEIHDECLYRHIIGLRSARPAAGVDGASHLLLRRYLDHSVRTFNGFGEFVAVISRCMKRTVPL